MKKVSVVAGLISLFVVSAVSGQDKTVSAGHATHVVAHPDAGKWGPAPAFLPPGSQMRVLVGDPGKPGVPYVLWARMPDGYKVPPHWHPGEENIVVLKGTFLVGKGDQSDPSRMEKLPAGSFVHMPKTMRHYVMANGETVIQVHGIGPLDIQYVNPADDPRKKETKK